MRKMKRIFGRSRGSLAVLVSAVIGPLSLPAPADGPTTRGVAAPEAARPLTYHVATNGNDSWSGALPSPDAGGTDGPFATLARARDAIRAARERDVLKQPVRVLVRGGRYRLTSPVVLTARDSGTRGCPVSFEAFADEVPVLSGGRTIGGWRPHKGQILRATIPEVKNGKWRFRQLFHKGRRQIVARCPNADPADPLYGGWAFVEEVAGATTLKYDGGIFTRKWAKPRQAEVFIFPWFCWISDIVSVGAVDVANKTIALTRPPGEPNPVLAAGKHYAAIPHPLTRGNRFFVQNVLEELDQPGEWCLDREAGMVYFWPPDGPPGDGEVTAPATDRIIELRGTAEAPVRHVTIAGLTFTQTLALFPPRYLECNAPNSRGFCLYMEHTENCTVRGNRFEAVGGDAIRLEYGSTANRIIRNEIARAGAMGINFNNTRDGGFDFPQTWKVKVLEALARDRPVAARNVVSGNHIHHCGVIDKFGAAIKIHGLNCVDNVISHNEIHDVPHAAIAITHGFGRNTIEYNEIDNVCLEMADAGAFYSNRWFVLPEHETLSRGTVVRYNRISNVIGCGAYGRANVSGGGAKAGGRILSPYYTFAVYFDNSPVRASVYGNIISGSVLACVAMPVAQAIGNTVENNVLIAAGRCQPLRIASGSGNRFIRNIVYHTTPNIEPEHAWPLRAIAKADCDRNVYHHAGPGQFTAGLRKFELWKKDGYDAHSVVADPMFVDAANGDYRLRPESPALKLGFKPIPAERIGRGGGDATQRN